MDTFLIQDFNVVYGELKTVFGYMDAKLRYAEWADQVDTNNIIQLYY